jgi:hypothetical protein
MPEKPGHTPQSLPVANYSRAIARAVEWLGDRYLLATPINVNARPLATVSAKGSMQGRTILGA